MIYIYKKNGLMKKLLFLCLLINTLSFAQDTEVKNNSKKGSFYAYWGWNNAMYSNSDISFKGVNYDFTLYDVAAKDRQSPFAFDTYFLSVTIPQYNLRLGYYLNEKYHITLGVDHMKYVMRAYQNATISGTITN